MAEPLPGKGFFGWLGRQVGYVAKAVKSDVAQKLYESQHVQEHPHPSDPSLTLRRTTTDEIVKKPDEK